MNEHLENLKEIRSLMERSSKFLSLSGLSGIAAGSIALIAAYIVYAKKVELTGDTTPKAIFDANAYVEGDDFKVFLIKTALVTLVAAIFFGVYFTMRKAQKEHKSVWNNLSKNLLISLLVPLVSGGLFCLALLYHGVLWVIPSATLLFYGLALFSAAKYTVRDVTYLAISEIVLGLLSLVLTGYSLIFWAVGFGVLHIFYGAIMYWKYEK